MHHTIPGLAVAMEADAAAAATHSAIDVRNATQRAAVCKRLRSPRPEEEEGRLRLVELEPRGEGREERRHGKVLHQLWR